MITFSLLLVLACIATPQTINVPSANHYDTTQQCVHAHHVRVGPRTSPGFPTKTHTSHTHTHTHTHTHIHTHASNNNSASCYHSAFSLLEHITTPQIMFLPILSSMHSQVCTSACPAKHTHTHASYYNSATCFRTLPI